MIVICQTADSTLLTLKRHLGDERENVFYTRDHRRALEHFQYNEDVFGRPVAVLSNLYPGELVNGGVIASSIKGMRPDAWCFLFTCMPNAAPLFGAVDGVIDKMDSRVPWDAICQLADAGIDDPEKFPDLDSLFKAFPWIQRPAR